VTNTHDHPSQPAPRGRVLHAAAGYDLLVWLLLLGRERAFREQLVRLARLEQGQSVLDVGCGTGSLAIAARRLVGPAGQVEGVDASPELIARARRKAGKAGVDVRFTIGGAETLPFPDAKFDAVLNTMVLHHLPRETRERCAREMRRVVRPGGRVLAVDFGGTRGERKGLIKHFHRHAGVGLHDIIDLLTNAGLRIVESGAVGVRGLNFVLAAA
jgi:ubiquinone/menaquinone biosynthesis C-methylase UbiE